MSLAGYFRYVYKRLKFLGNKLTSWGLTMLFVSIWHGVWPGYYINFSLEMIIILAERTVSVVGVVRPTTVCTQGLI